jgi:tetratricopeptide (TPR) repeat protein/HEAT repeat protein
VPSISDAQFNPEGRQRSRPKPTAPAKPSTPKPSGSGTGATERRAEQATTSTDALIERYARIVLEQPGAAFPLQRLSELYRARDGKLDALIARFEALAAEAGPGRHNALVALGGVYRQAGEPERAAERLEQAIVERPNSAVALEALGQLKSQRGDKKGAVERFEQALRHVKGGPEREQLQRTVIGLWLDLGNYDAAKQHHDELVQRSGGSFFVRSELGRALYQRGAYERAVAEFRRVATAAAGDNRVLAAALRDLGDALVQAGKPEEGLAVLERALAAAGAQAGLRREIHGLVVAAYRAQNRIPELVEKLEREGQQDFDRLVSLAGLYEETGRLDRALETYKKASERNPRDLDTRVKVVRLLHAQGDLDAVIKEYEALIRTAPHNPDYVFALAEALVQRGERTKALAQLERLEARSRGNADVLSALADFYDRLDEKQKSRDVLERVVETGTLDPQHLVELGNRYWEEGNKARALETWQRLKLSSLDKARALEELGAVYLEHDMVLEALEAYRQAVKTKPEDRRYHRSLAIALERAAAKAERRDLRFQQNEEARKIWEELLKQAANDRRLAREARQHIVRLWSADKVLNQRVGPLERRLSGTPPDLEAGRLLSEALIRLRRYPEAERVLKRVIALSPGDADSLVALERVLVQQGRLRDAIQTLESLVRADPQNARSYYQKMAEHASGLYADDEAVRYASRAVELNPDDAEGFRKLGEMHRRRQETDQAIEAYRRALAKNDRLFSAYLALAELLVGKGEIDEADRLLRHVVRRCPDEELLGQAAAMSMQVNLGRGALTNLERDLFTMALGHPHKPVYRRLLLEVYGAMAFPLAHQAKSPDAGAARDARRELARLGERAVKPLLDALGDTRAGHQRIAIELLGHMRNRGAGAALVTFAAGGADPELRSRAMLAAGMLEDPSLLTKLEGVLIEDGHVRSDEADPVVLAAGLAVARMRSLKARPLLLSLLESEAPSLRALAALGLGLLEDRAAAPKLIEVARALDAGPAPRAAAVSALGMLGDKRALRLFRELSESSDTRLRAASLLALARLDGRASEGAIAEALLSGDALLERAAALAAVVSRNGKWQLGEDPLYVDTRVDVRALLDALLPEPGTPDEQRLALADLAPVLTARAVTLVQSSPEGARIVANALSSCEGGPCFGALGRHGTADHKVDRAAREALDALADALIAPYVALSGHPTPDVRALAVAFLAARPGEPALRALVGALEDQDETVVRAALAAAEQHRRSEATSAITELVRSSREWPLRLRAARALGGLGEAARTPESQAALTKAAQHDPYALVREAAVRALGRVAPGAAQQTLDEIARNDPEPRVRDAAREVARRP